ncbi:MAG TPA: CoA pyrophosphatase [Kofleriaceae bacterium]
MSLISQLAEKLNPESRPKGLADTRCAAVAIVLRQDPESDEPRVLLMKRAERQSDPWSGHISLPGGRYEPEDPDLLATAIRETREELSIDLSTARLLGHLPALHPMSAGPKGMQVTAFVFVVESALDPKPSAEALAAFWLPLESAYAGTYDQPYKHAPTGMDFPSWAYDGYVVWGLTHRILADLRLIARS